MAHRYYTLSPLEEGEEIQLDSSELKHLKNVMRTKSGEIIEVVDGCGTLAKATYGESITAVEVTKKQKPQITKSLALALTEPKHLELVIEKAVELGIDAIYVFPSIKSKLRSLSDNKKVRIDKILISSLKQSKRLFLPAVTYLRKKEDLPSEENYLLADFGGEKFLPITKSATFIIGPESGFTKEEIIYFKESLSANGVLLSKNVLRTETAAICAATLLSI